MMNGNGGFRGFRGIQRGCFLTTKTCNMRPSSQRCVRFQTKGLSEFNDYATLGLTPFASKYDVKFAYKRLALKYHPDVIKGGDHVTEKSQTFREIKSAYESLMQKFEEEEQMQMQSFDEYDEWDEWMGFEGGMPTTTFNSC